jgi:hypothetical protein
LIEPFFTRARPSPGEGIKGTKYLIPISLRPSLQWLKTYHQKHVRCIVINNEVKEIEDEKGNLIYPERDMV